MQATHVPREATPPKLGILSETPQFQVSSTFADSFQQAADHINTKYSIESLKEPVNGSGPFLNHPLGLAQSDKPSPTSSIFETHLYENARGQDSGSSQPEAVSPVNCRPSEHETSSRIPVHWLDKILEQSISLRTPLEEPAENETILGVGRMPNTVTRPRCCQLRRKGAVKLSAATREDRKIAKGLTMSREDLQRRHAWSFPADAPTTHLSPVLSEHLYGMKSLYRSMMADLGPVAVGTNRHEEGRDILDTDSGAFVSAESGSTTTAVMQASGAPMGSENCYQALPNKPLLKRLE